MNVNDSMKNYYDHDHFFVKIFAVDLVISDLDQGPLAAQMRRCPDWDTLGRPIPFQHLHSECQGNLQGENSKVKREIYSMIDDILSGASCGTSVMSRSC